MPITLNGTTGVVTPGATVGSITGILKATSGVVSQAVAGSDYGQLTLATAQSATGTAVDFTSIPSWAKRITVMFNGVSTDGSSPFQVQIGSGSFVTSGYDSTGTSASNSVGTITATGGFLIYLGSPTTDCSGHMIITLFGNNTWISSCTFKATPTVTGFGAGDVTLSGTLDRLRVTTVNGTDTFDAGTINISYE